MIAKGTECRKMAYCDYKNVLTCKGSFTKKTTDEFIKMTSTFAFMCVDSINNFADIKSFKNIFDTYRKNIDYISPNLDIAKFDLK